MDIVRRNVGQHAETLCASGIAPVLARIYAARGIATLAELDDRLATLPLHGEMKGGATAAARLADAIGSGEKLLIVADYDSDGATACAVAVRGLRAMGASVDYLVPNRFEHGYGLTPEIVALASERQPQLIITVDNGIASIDGVAAAHALGIEVLVTDHHLPGATLPPALIVNPNQPGCGFPSKHLAGVGVVFYVLVALRACLRGRGHFAGRDEPRLADLLDLVALGTVADVVRLDRVNRVLVEQGLKRIRARRMQPGLRALFEVAGRDPSRATGYDLGFVLGPRLNAAGRLADMSLGIECLLADDDTAALRLAAELDRLNRERRDVEASMQTDALVDLDQAGVADDAYTICAHRPEWHQGVVGIVAARLKDRFHRPAVVFAPASGDELRGSGRSIAGFHLRDALDLLAKRNPDVLRRFGGHAYAAGVSLHVSALPRFVQAFEEIGREWLTPALLKRRLETDGGLAPEELTLALAHELGAVAWGQGFPAPVFDDEFEVLEQRPVGQKHLRLELGRGRHRFAAMLFNAETTLPARARLAYRPDPDFYQGTWSLKLVIEHWLAV